jgi:hypothetical protein
MRITGRNLRRLIRESITREDEMPPSAVKAISALIVKGVELAMQNPMYPQAKAARTEIQDRDYDEPLDEERGLELGAIYNEGMESIKADQRIKRIAETIVKMIFKLLPPDRKLTAEESTDPERDMQFIVNFAAYVIARRALDFYLTELERETLHLFHYIEYWTKADSLIERKSESRKITARGPTLHVLREASAPVVLNVDSYKPVIRKLLIGAVEDARDALGEEKVNEFVSRYVDAGADNWRVVKELAGNLDGMPNKNASALITVLKSIALRSGSLMSKLLGVEVPTDDRSGPEENINSTVANLLMTLSDPRTSLDEFTTVDKSACFLLVMSFNWTTFFATDFIRQEVREILEGDPTRVDSKLDSLRFLIRDVAGMIRFTEPHSGNRDLDDYSAHWLKVITRTIDQMAARRRGEAR